MLSILSVKTDTATIELKPVIYTTINSSIDQTIMLILKPNCELCDIDLPANSVEARICAYECTFCRDCVDTVLENVCPNCGGGFTDRPIRPITERREGVSRNLQKPSNERILSKYTKKEILEFAAKHKDTPPHKR